MRRSRKEKSRSSGDVEGLNVVSFVQLREDEKLGRYEKFEERRLKKGLKTIFVKGYINTISGGQFTRGTVSIIFIEQDLEKIDLPHANPLVIKLRISDNLVSRVLVDGGSSYDIIFWHY